MKKLLDNKLFLKILSVLIAIGLWIFVLYTVKPVTQKVYKDIEITFKGEYVLDDENLVIVKDKPLKATVELKGPRTDIAKISSENITVSANVENIKKSGTYYLDYTAKINGNNITVLSVTPSSGGIKIEPKREKSIPLSVTATGTMPKDDEVLKTELLMNNVVISGPKSQISKITKAVAYIDRTHVFDGEYMEIPYVLQDENGKTIEQTASLKAEFEFAKITCHILHKRSITIYPIINGSTAKGTAIDSISVSPKTVTVVGPQSIIKSLTHIETAPIDVSHQSSQKIYKGVKLILPEKIEFYHQYNQKEENISTADVTINLADSTTKDIPITYLESKNSDDQSKFTFDSSSLIVTVSGTEKNIQNAEIHATVDISGLEPGEHTVPVTLTTSPYVSINGTYTANINVLN